MGLFEKKYCDFCGSKIGLLGNRKLEDGNMCKQCASKLSPWFSERRHSTKADIRGQLEYREENSRKAAMFHTTRSIGRHTKLLLDEDAHRFTVTSASSVADANPDILDYSQITGCDLDIEESRTELKRKGPDGKMISYAPPKYEYSYNFFVTIQVNNPYFDDMRYSLSNGYIKTGEKPVNAASGAWQVKPNYINANQRLNDYYEYLKMGSEIKRTVDRMRAEGRKEASSSPAPNKPVKCPNCGAIVVPDSRGCCEYCGGII